MTTRSIKLVPPIPPRRLKATLDEWDGQWKVTPRYTGKTYSGFVQWNHEAMQAVEREKDRLASLLS
jgi:hypothetical protein